jgi:hypothetical protein
MFKRTRYQFGWLRRKPRRRGPDVWVWTYRSRTPSGGQKENSVIVGTVLKYPSKAEAWKATEGLRSRGNSQATCDSEPVSILDQESHQTALGNRSSREDQAFTG